MKKAIVYLIGSIFLFIVVFMIMSNFFDFSIQLGDKYYGVSLREGFKHYSICVARQDSPSTTKTKITSFNTNDSFNVLIEYENPIFLVTTSDTGSMRPTISDFSRVIVTTITSETELKVGDIVSRYGVMHRITKIEEQDNKSIYTLRGDNNIKSDGRFERGTLKFKAIGIIY